MVSNPEGSTNNSPMDVVESDTMNNPRTRNSLSPFFSLLDVKQTLLFTCWYLQKKLQTNLGRSVIYGQVFISREEMNRKYCVE